MCDARTYRQYMVIFIAFTYYAYLLMVFKLNFL
jgi:hypothetical protein